MSTSKRGLGRGFDTLIPTDVSDEGFDPVATAAAGGPQTGERVVEVKVEVVSPNPHQPRQTFDAGQLAQLAESIKTHGILQPLIVTQAGEGYQLIAGERRLRAAGQAGLDTVPVIVRSFDEQAKLELALIENLQRADLNPIETAVAYRQLIDQFNLTLEQMSRRIGKNFSTISNTTRLLGLPPEAKQAIIEGKLTEGHGRVILSVPKLGKQQDLLKMMLDRGWTVRQAEEFARALKPKSGTITKGLNRLTTTNAVTESLGQKLKTKVSLKRMAKGGRLMIDFRSDNDLERISRLISEQ